MTNHIGGSGPIGVIFSPRPVTKAGSLYTQNGTSESIVRANFANSSRDIFKFQILFKPLKTAAASADPPPIPAETGICLSISISTPSGLSNLDCRSFAAW